MPEPELELLVDIPEAELPGAREQFEQLGFKVVTTQQSADGWALAAAKCSEETG